MFKNVAGQVIGAQVVNATTGGAFASTVTVYVTKDGGTQLIGSVGSGVCTAEGNGYFTYAPSRSETNGDLVAFTFTGTGAVPVTVQVPTETPPSSSSTTGSTGGTPELPAGVEFTTAGGTSPFYYDRVGYPPVATSLDFRAWVDAYYADRISLVPDSATATHFYFSNTTGSDTNSGSVGSPYQTTAKAQEKIDGWGNSPLGLYLHFADGDSWDMNADDRLSFNGSRYVVVTDYGDRSKGLPYFSQGWVTVAFSALSTSTDRVDAFANTLSCTDAQVAGEIVVVRDLNCISYAYKFVASVAAVDAEPGTCFRSGTTLYLRPFTRSTYLQYVEFLTADPTPTVPFFGTSDAGWGPNWLMNLNATGCGVVRYTTEAGVNAKAAFWFGGNSDDFIGLVNCESTYYSRHGIVTSTPTGFGGTPSGTILFLDRCRVGWGTAGNDSTAVVANCHDGLTEFAAYDCELVGGVVQRPGIRGGVGLTSHTSGDPGVYSLLDLCVRLRVRPTSGNMTSPVGFSNPQLMTTLATCRSFVVDCDVPQRELDEHDRYETADSIWSGCAFLGIDASTVVLGGHFCATLVSTNFDGTGHTVNGTGEILSPSGIDGVYIGSTHAVDATRSKAGKTAIYPSAIVVLGASAWRASWYHARFEWYVGGGASGGWVGQQFMNTLYPPGTSRTVRSVFAVYGGSAATPAYYGGNAEECAYFDVQTKFLGSVLPGADYVTNDADAVILGSAGTDGRDPDLALDDDTTVTVGGVGTTLEYDVAGYARSGRNAIGPYAGLLPVDADDLPPLVVASTSWQAPGAWMTAPRPAAASQHLGTATKTAGGDFYIGLNAAPLLEIKDGTATTVVRAACTCDGATTGDCVVSPTGATTTAGQQVEAEFTAFTTVGTYEVLWDVVLSDGTRHKFPGTLVVTAT